MKALTTLIFNTWGFSFMGCLLGVIFFRHDLALWQWGAWFAGNIVWAWAMPFSWAGL